MQSGLGYSFTHEITLRAASHGLPILVKQAGRIDLRNSLVCCAIGLVSFQLVLLKLVHTYKATQRRAVRLCRFSLHIETSQGIQLLSRPERSCTRAAGLSQRGLPFLWMQQQSLDRLLGRRSSSAGLVRHRPGRYGQRVGALLQHVDAGAAQAQRQPAQTHCQIHGNGHVTMRLLECVKRREEGIPANIVPLRVIGPVYGHVYVTSVLCRLLLSVGVLSTNSPAPAGLIPHI